MSNPTPSDSPPPPASPRRRIALHWKILIGLLLGAVLGIAAHAHFARPQQAGVVDARDQDANGVDDQLDRFALNVADPIGRVFLRLVLMVVLPLVISALALAVVELGDLRRLGRVGLRTLFYTLFLSSVAVLIGITLVNTLRPGERLGQAKREALKEQYSKAAADTVAKSKAAKPLKDMLLDIIPENPLQEMAGALDGSSKGNGIIAVMFFALIFGAAVAQVGDSGHAVVKFLEGVFAASMRILDWAIRLAPLGVACLIFAMTSRLGGELLVTLAWFVG
ncbi:MAG: dicarboxylate/amino acid:cation symporter, partial [Pirellulaceae bacterium]|nr:dicarboxylate/amino acid:cation symporter [Pirellulaceae bacterium]